MDFVKKKIEQIIETVGMVLLCIITVLTLSQVLLRYVIQIPFMWSEEFTRFLFIWLVWVGAVLGIPRGAHMVIDTFRDRFFGTKAIVVKLIMQLFSLVFLLVVIIKGWSLAQSMTYEYHITFPVSVKYTYLASAVCGALMFYYLVLELWTTLRELRNGRITE